MTKDLKNEKESGELKAKLSNLNNTYVNNNRPSKYVMKKHGILKWLLNNNIVILRQYKNDDTVIMDRVVYIQKILEIIKNRSKFKNLYTDPAIIRGGKLQGFLRSMKEKTNFTIKTYEQIYPTDSKSVFIYGTPKIHKLKHNINPPNMRLCSDVSFRSHIGRDVADHAETSSWIRNWYVNKTDLFETSLRPLIGT